MQLYEKLVSGDEKLALVGLGYPLYSYLDNLYYGSFMGHYSFLRLCT